jgi:hypothetical protein
MRATFLVIAVLVMPFLARAQSRDTVFTVKAPVSSIKLVPNTDVLYKDITKKFKLVYPAGTVIDSVVFIGGELKRNDTVLYIKPTQSKTVLLKVYERLASGKTVLALAKEFNAVKFQEPRPNVDGVSADSMIHRMKVVAQGYVNMPVNPDPALKRISHPVVYFEMWDYTQGKQDVLKAAGNRMTYDMRNRIDKMDDGGVIEIQNIKYVVSNDTLTYRQPIRVYLVNDKINKF